MSLPFTAETQWIWSVESSRAAPAPEYARTSHYQVRLSCRTLESARSGDLPARILVSAGSCIALSRNGELVGRGPAKGDFRAVRTPWGLVRVAWRVEAGRLRLEGDAPAVTPVRVRLPGGEHAAFAGGPFALEGAVP